MSLLIYFFSENKCSGWGRKSVCFPLWICLAIPPTEHRICRPCFLLLMLQFQAFYRKHLEPLNSYSVRILKRSNQSFHIYTRTRSYKFKEDCKSFSLFLQVWELAGRQIVCKHVQWKLFTVSIPISSLWLSAHPLYTRSAKPFKRSRSTLRLLHAMGLTCKLSTRLY